MDFDFIDLEDASASVGSISNLPSVVNTGLYLCDIRVADASQRNKNEYDRPELPAVIPQVHLGMVARPVDQPDAAPGALWLDVDMYKTSKNDPFSRLCIITGNVQWVQDPQTGRSRVKPVLESRTEPVRYARKDGVTEVTHFPGFVGKQVIAVVKRGTPRNNGGYFFNTVIFLRTDRYDVKEAAGLSDEDLHKLPTKVFNEFARNYQSEGDPLLPPQKKERNATYGGHTAPVYGARTASPYGAQTAAAPVYGGGLQAPAQAVQPSAQPQPQPMPQAAQSAPVYGGGLQAPAAMQGAPAFGGVATGAAYGAQPQAAQPVYGAQTGAVYGGGLQQPAQPQTQPQPQAGTVNPDTQAGDGNDEIPF